jgi:CheY-like chemotaxis protein
MPKVLIVFEEDIFLGNVINQKIKEEGYQTLFITNAAVAIEQMKLFAPSTVVLDMELKSIDAFKLLEKKSRDEKVAGIPVIVASAIGDIDEIKKVVELGVRDYIVKSQFNADELINKLNNVIPNKKRGGGSEFLKNKKVMWVEDDQFLSDLIARKFSQLHCKLLFTRTGEEALELLSKDQPDIILLDLLLPGISGFEVLEHIKSDKNLKRIPVIILSNFTQNNEMERTKAMGAERFLTKATVVLDDIVEEVKKVLEDKNHGK